MTHRTAFARLISRSGLKKLAGDKYFKRGLAYFRGGAVVQLRLGDDGISARVGGTEPCPYLVRIWIEKRKLRWGCACPLGTGGAFCKHLVLPVRPVTKSMQAPSLAQALPTNVTPASASRVLPPID